MRLKNNTRHFPPRQNNNIMLVLMRPQKVVSLTFHDNYLDLHSTTATTISQFLGIITDFTQEVKLLNTST